MTASQVHTSTVEGRLDLMGTSPEELAELLAERFGAPSYRASQIFSWVHRHLVLDFSQMTNLPKDLRRGLSEWADLDSLDVVATRQAPDGTTKLGLRTRDGLVVETVLIPEADKLTQCLSTQVGCRMGCRFCATGQMGLKRNLSAAEIVAQVAQGRRWATEHGRRLTNLVYMGMGEPLDNYGAVVRSLRLLTHPEGMDFSTRRITLSTVGHLPGLSRLAREPFQVNLAVSLNATDQQTRSRIMPASRRWPLSELLEALARFPLERRRRITLEYVLLAGVNDRPHDADRLARIARRLRAKVNLIRFNPFEGALFEPPSVQATEAFADRVRARNVTVLLRKSRGEEIQAACGQLAGQLDRRERGRDAVP